MPECRVIKPCFIGRRYKPGELVIFEGDKIPSYLEKIEVEVVKPVKEKKLSVITE